jgi:16S rRNA (cytidine1402-2'-O)-methyltransferase
VSGRLILCGTPIGNLEDTSQRALRVLGEADVVACEDTRRTRKLLTHFGVHARDLVSYHDANERRRARDLVERVKSGDTVVLVSDAGMPGVSDPGYLLVRACIEAGLPVEVVPGPSAAISALVVSGLPAGRFVFEGFLPRRPADRRRHLEDLADDPRTIVCYESPHRIVDTLGDMLHVLGDRPACLARELTKMHEEVRRAELSELLRSVVEDPPRGEIVMVVGGAIHEHKQTATPDELADRAQRLMDGGMERRAAMATVAKQEGVSKRVVFDALVRRRDATG